MTTCPCGHPADDVISLSANYHVKACPMCAVQWPLVRSAIQATERRHWTICDFTMWRKAKEVAQ